MKCFISKNYRHMNSAGDKAKTDIEAVMLHCGYRNIGLKQGRSTNAVKAYITTLASQIKGLARLRKGDILVVQYPLKKYYDMVVKTARRRGAKVITVIHDLGSFRRKKLTIAEEIERLNRSSAIVAHTPHMKQWLVDNGINVPVEVLGLFDYRSDTVASEVMTQPLDRPQLMFAGDLSPANNRWLYLLAEDSPNVDLILYVAGIDKSMQKANMITMGLLPSDRLIAEAKGDYGLVWYGDTLDGGVGRIGEYLQYNAPHKASLYIRAGKPLIIWDKAGLAGIVEELGIGLTVKSLKDIGKTLAEITPEQYAGMCQRVHKVSAMLAEGHFINKALEKAIQEI